jgi:hypothetical protein
MTRLADITDCPLDRSTPFGIANVSQTQFSIARYSGGCTFQDRFYVYNPITDELIRDDVLRWAAKRQEEQAKQARIDAKNNQSTIL